jgi:hypothetical protein
MGHDVMTDTTENPSRQFGWRARLSWRRTARRIVAEHREDLLLRLGGFRGLPLCGLTTNTAGTVRMMLPGWAITVVGVAARAQVALSAAVEKHACYMADAGRYGPFWWVAVNHDPTSHLRPTVILGPRLVVTRIEDGDAQLEAPSASPLLTTC